ncbi:MAG: hypothetical protein GC181_11870 [Bacteroidetes bacterium]|nr:hypothetical protein [Bacteroidota bacterium]
MIKLFGILFILTGIFAILGGLYTWGDGPLLNQTELIKLLIPAADVILTGPASLICGYGVLKKLYWADLIAIAVSGIYIFGSVLVFISLLWNQNFSALLIIPAVSGFSIGLGFIIFRLRIIGRA